MKRATRLFPIALLVAVCASAQVPDSDRIEDLTNFHDPTGDALLCWDTNGRWDFDLASCACSAPDEVFDSVDGCHVPVAEPVCGDGTINQTTERCDGADLGGETCESQGFDGGTLSCTSTCAFDTSQCTTTTGGGLAGGTWRSIPGSDMRTGGPSRLNAASAAECDAFWDGTNCTLFDPAIDDQWGDVGAPNSFKNIQSAWSGGARVGGELCVMGGGHGDGAHNGVFCIDVQSGEWRRATMPSPIWQDTDPAAPHYCPERICTPPIGDPCHINRCNVLPDGTATARHSYDLLSGAAPNFYVLGGGIWSELGVAGNQPRAWKLDVQTGEWTPLADSGLSASGGTAIVGPEIFYISKSFDGRKYDSVADVWDTGNLSSSAATHTALVYAPSVDRLFALGGGKAFSIARSEWPNGTPTDYGAQGAALDRPGVVYFPPEDLILLWNGGQTIETLDPNTGAWGAVTLAGDDPGPRLDGGTFGRFNYIADRIVLVNGVDAPMYYVDLGTSAPEPEPEPEPEPQPDPGSGGVAVMSSFTEEEAVQVMNQREALQKVSSSAYWSVIHAAVNQSDAAAVADYVREVMGDHGWKGNVRSFIYLLDSGASGDDVLNLPREQVVAVAAERLAKPRYQDDRERLRSIPNDSEALATAKNLLDEAIALRNSFDATLAYTEPRMRFNMALDGATRERSSGIHVHGDYRTIGRSAFDWAGRHSIEWEALADGFQACPGWLPGNKEAAFLAGHLENIAKSIIDVAVMGSGLEPPKFTEVLDIMEAGISTSGRGREFVLVELALESMLMWDHTRNEPFDVNGRETLRGKTYDLDVISGGWERAITTTIMVPDTYCAGGDPTALILAAAKGVGATGQAWGDMDNLAFHGFFLRKHFQVFPPPGPKQ